MTDDESSSTNLAARPSRGVALLRVLGLGLLFGVLGTFSFAPYGQFYLAWVALVPLMWLASTACSGRSAFAGGFIAGLFYFFGNLWFIGLLGLLPLVGLMLYLALYPAVFCVLWRPIARSAMTGRQTVMAVVLGATLWTGLEWLRGVLFTGLPMVLIGHSQSPLLAGIQIADTVGAYGISFWVALVNAAAWACIHHGVRGVGRQALPAIATTAVVLVGVFGYGFYRLGGSILTPGPTVLLLQPNFPMRNDEPLDQQALVMWHVEATEQSLAEDPDVDLVVWPESVGPWLNLETRSLGLGGDVGRQIEQTHEFLKAASRLGPNLLVGAGYAADWTTSEEGYLRIGDRRNSVYLYADGRQQDIRYDKTHLVTFGEYLPFRTWPPPIGWLYPIFAVFHPWGSEWELTAGDTDTLVTIAGERQYRAITPICFEDFVPERVRQMAYGDRFESNGKRADVLVNVTNDGWFRGTQMAQHMQAALFRSVENRLPTARAVNTGVSAVIDPTGRVTAALPSGVAGVLRGQLMLDERSSPFGLVGDLFAQICFATTVAAMLAVGGTALRQRSARRREMTS